MSQLSNFREKILEKISAKQGSFDRANDRSKRSDMISAIPKEHISVAEEIAIGEHSATCEEAHLDAAAELKVELLPSNGARKLKFSPSTSSIKSSSSSESSLREGKGGRIRVPTSLQDTQTPNGNTFINGAIQYGKRAAEELIQQMAKSSMNGDMREQSLLTDEIELDDADSGSDELEFLPTLPTSSSKSNGFTSAARLKLRSALVLLDSCRCSSQRVDNYSRCNIM